jgi:homoserine kinase
VSNAFTVRVPATSANLGSGFDALGLALTLYDVVSAEPAEVTSVDVVGEGAGELPTDEKHLIVQVMRETFAEVGLPAPALRLTCVNAIPQARGLGSSSAAIVAGVTLANALAGGPLDRAGELRLAARIEGHPDNVAPCLLGGFTIAWLAKDGARAVSMPPSPFVRPTLLVPGSKNLTTEARAALPGAVPHADAAFNVGRSALLVHALTAAPDLLFEATEDRLHQGYRAPGMPETAAMVEALRERGAPAMVSGSGPTVLILGPVPASFSAGEGWLTHNLAAQSGGAEVLAGNISSTFGHAD